MPSIRGPSPFFHTPDFLESRLSSFFQVSFSSSLAISTLAFTLIHSTTPRPALKHFCSLWSICTMTFSPSSKGPMAEWTRHSERHFFMMNILRNCLIISSRQKLEAGTEGERYGVVSPDTMVIVGALSLNSEFVTWQVTRRESFCDKRVLWPSETSGFQASAQDFQCARWPNRVESAYFVDLAARHAAVLTAHFAAYVDLSGVLRLLVGRDMEM